MVPTRSAQLAARPSALSRVSSPWSSPRPSMPVDALLASRVAEGLVRSTSTATGPRSTRARWLPSASTSAPVAPAASIATPRWERRPSVETARSTRPLARATVSAPTGSSAPLRRRSSAASVGPRKAASARPRPSSSAMIATSTAEARGALASPAARSSASRRPRRRRRAWRSARRLRGRPPSSGPVGRPPGPRSRAAPLLGREADVHSASFLRRVGILRRPLVAQGAAEDLSRG